MKLNWLIRRRYNKKHIKKRLVKTPKCKKCGGKNFDIGPRGGLSINIRCRECSKEYNVVRVFDIGYLMEEI